LIKGAIRSDRLITRGPEQGNHYNKYITSRNLRNIASIVNRAQCFQGVFIEFSPNDDCVKDKTRAVNPEAFPGTFEAK
jgi:hypothetical protein